SRIALQVAATGFQNRCDLAGTPNRQGTGHYHVLLDKSLVDMYCTNRAALSLEGLSPGRHTLTAVPAQNDHAEVEKNASSVTIEYQPAHPTPLPRPAAPPGKPAIKILSPKPGETVSGSYDVRVEVQNFTLTCDEMGKPNIAGHGHWHLNLDTMKGPMMGMMTMVAMSCERTLQGSTAGLNPGSSHKLIALLADNEHAPVMPEWADSIEVNVKWPMDSRELRAKYGSFARWYDLAEALPEALGVRRLRRRLLAQARGRVLEVAAGTGKSFRFYRGSSTAVAIDL